MLSDVGRVRDEGMGGDEVTDRTSSWPPADTDAIALVIGHGKRADGVREVKNLPFWPWGRGLDGRGSGYD